MSLDISLQQKLKDMQERQKLWNAAMINKYSNQSKVSSKKKKPPFYLMKKLEKTMRNFENKFGNLSLLSRLF